MRIEITDKIADATRIPHQGQTEAFKDYEARCEALRQAASDAYGERLGWVWDDVTDTDAVALLKREPREDDPAASISYMGVEVGYLKVI